MSGDTIQIEDVEDLFQELGDELYTYLEILCRDSETAGDILQNVFLKFIEYVQKNKNSVRKETVSAYLRTMARNEYYDHYRKDKKFAALTAEAADLIADENKIEKEETSRHIQTVLLNTLADPELPGEIGEVMRLRFLKDVGVDEITARIGKSRATVYRLMEKGMQMLARNFEKEGLTLEELSP